MAADVYRFQQLRCVQETDEPTHTHAHTPELPAFARSSDTDPVQPDPESVLRVWVG